MSVDTKSSAAPTSTTLYFGPWYSQSPMFESTLRAGCSAYDIYNHMYLPAYYDDPTTEYWALLNGVTLWDVGVERVVQISGPDAFELTNLLTCRDLTRCAVGQGKYALITAPDGGIVNDPVLLRRAEDTFWLCLADSDVHLYALGVATGRGMDVEVSLPPVHPVQVQGPKAKDVMTALVAAQLLDVRYYWTLDTEIAGIPVVISRTGWTGEVGYEVYLTDPSHGSQLWQAIMDAGREHDIRPIAPCEARRIEAGIFNYNSDITLADNPFQVMGLERLVEPQGADYIGKAALERIRNQGVSRRLVGIEMPGDPLAFELAEVRPALHEGKPVGRVTDLVWSPRLERNIGYVWLPTELSSPGTPVQVEGSDGRLADASTAAIPFLDPAKQVPAA
jgi:aminomethyltransferase